MLGFRAPVPWEPQVLLHLSDTHSRPYPCTLRGLNKGTLHVVSAQPIEKAAGLTISFGEAMIAGTVLYCSPKKSHYLICIVVASPPETRRREPRLPCNQTCALTALGHKRSEKFEAVITDISASGMGLHMSQSIEIGTMIYVETEDFLAAGQILHCRRLDEGQFAAGVELTDVLWGEKRSAASWSLRGRNWLRRIWSTSKLWCTAA